MEKGQVPGILLLVPSVLKFGSRRFFLGSRYIYQLHSILKPHKSLQNEVQQHQSILERL